MHAVQCIPGGTATTEHCDVLSAHVWCANAPCVFSWQQFPWAAPLAQLRASLRQARHADIALQAAAVAMYTCLACTC